MFRYVNNDDIVARVPTRAMQYSHAGTFRFFDRNGVQQDHFSWWDIVVNRIESEIQALREAQIADIVDHQLTRYVANLQRALGTSG